MDPSGSRPNTRGGVPGRRTVTIQGRGSERYIPPRSRRRPHQRAYERSGFRPDRAAMWAVLLGVVLVLAAATSSRANVGAWSGAGQARSPALIGAAQGAEAGSLGFNMNPNVPPSGFNATRPQR